MVITGFTGPRTGVTDAQLGALAAVLTRIDRDDGALSLHHGGAEGADEGADGIAVKLGARITVLPTPDRFDVWLKRTDYPRSIAAPMAPLVRNRTLVRMTRRLVATPPGFDEVNRSGTWSTIRWARRERRRITFVWPDGTVTEGEPK